MSNHELSSDALTVFDVGALRVVSSANELASLAGPLHIACAPQITDQALADICAVHRISTLSLAGCVNITNEGLESLRMCKALERLSLNFCEQINYRGLMSVCEIDSLQWLDLSNCSAMLAATDGSLDCISRLGDLEVLNAAYIYDLSDPACSTIARLTKLKALSLDGCEAISDRGIRNIAHLPNLEVLYLPAFAEWGDEVLKALAVHARALRWVNLSMLSQVTDSGLAYLATIGSLESVVIDSCGNVTMDGLKELAHAPNLKRIEILGQLATTDVANVLVREKATLHVVVHHPKL